LSVPERMSSIRTLEATAPMSGTRFIVAMGNSACPAPASKAPSGPSSRPSPIRACRKFDVLKRGCNHSSTNLADSITRKAPSALLVGFSGTTGYRGRVHFSDFLPESDVRPEIIKIGELWEPRRYDPTQRRFYERKRFSTRGQFSTTIWISICGGGAQGYEVSRNSNHRKC
jgi:hypothetical protein